MTDLREVEAVRDTGLWPRRKRVRVPSRKQKGEQCTCRIRMFPVH